MIHTHPYSKEIKIDDVVRQNGVGSKKIFGGKENCKWNTIHLDEQGDKESGDKTIVHPIGFFTIGKWNKKSHKYQNTNQDNMPLLGNDIGNNIASQIDVKMNIEFTPKVDWENE